MQILEFVQLGVVLLFIATLVSIVVKRLRMPYTAGLVVVGLALALGNPYFVGLSETFAPEAVGGLLVPQVILGIFIPPLIFEAALHLKLEELRRNLALILLFAVPGVVVTMFLVGEVIAFGTPLALEVALVFGALIAATDPVAVIALFRSLGVPKRLQILLEGESLFNDGTAIVIFNLMLTLVANPSSFNFWTTLWDFVRIAGGGLVIGFTVAILASLIMRRINDNLLEITLTLVTAYGSYLIAEELHFSGVLAVVAAGLASGDVGPRSMSPSTRIALFNFWQYAAFLANSLVFLMIGLIIDLGAVIANLYAILLAIAAVLVARAAVIYTFSRISPDLSTRIQHVLYWGGLRGAISLALALSLPPDILGENTVLLQAMAFGVVLFTVLGEGITMGPLVRRLGLTHRTPAEEAYERRQALAVAAKAAYDHLQELNRQGLISEHTWELLERPLRRQIEVRSEAVREILHSDRNVELAELNNAYREALRVQRAMFNQMFSGGSLNEETFVQLVSEVDSALLSESPNYPALTVRRSSKDPPIARLIAAAVREEDLENVSSLLNVLGVPATQLRSIDSARGTHLVTLLIGIEAGQEGEVVRAICDACLQDPRFLRPLASLGLPLPSQEKSVDRVTIYVMDIEHYEEF